MSKLLRLPFLLLALAAILMSCNTYRAERRVKKGIKLDKEGRGIEAIEQYKKAIKIKPDYAQAYFCLATSYYSELNYAEAIENFNKTIELNPEYRYAHQLLGMANISMKRR